MSLRVVSMLLVFGLGALAQEPTFTFTSASGKTVNGHFKSGSRDQGKTSITDEDDGNVSEIEIARIESMVLTQRKPPYNTKCSSYSKVDVVFSDGTKMTGCIVPYSLEFVTPNSTIQSVNTSIGKFVRAK